MPTSALRQSDSTSVDESQRGLGALVHRGADVDLPVWRHLAVRDLHDVGVAQFKYVRSDRFAEAVGLTQGLVDSYAHQLLLYFLGAFGSGPDYPTGRMARQFFVGQPAPIAQHLPIVLAEGRRRAVQPSTLAGQPGEWRAGIKTGPGARVVERLEESPIPQLRVLGHQ